MTLGLHDNTLDDYYNECIGKARTYLSARYPLEELKASDDEVASFVESLRGAYSEAHFWQVPVEGPWGTFEIIIVVPRTFPDGFPRLYLSKKDSDKYGLLPHVDHNRFICTRDPSIVVINDESPGEAIEQLLKVAAEEIVGPGVARENIGDLIDEFQAYWEEDCRYSVLATPPKSTSAKPEILNCFRLSHSVIGSQYFISSSAEEVARWTKPYGGLPESSSEAKVIYLPLPKRFSAEIFYTRKGVAFAILENLPPSFVQPLERFFNSSLDSYYVLCSFPLESGLVFFGWRHNKWKETKGFRKSHVPLKIRLLYARNEGVEKFKIIRIDKERVLGRAGLDGNLLKANAAIAIGGCGSVGGFLSMSLARSGISKFLLMDNERLELENIGRHLCGFTDISQQKVDAIEKTLHNQLPGIECKVYSEDILTLFLKHGRDLLQGYDLLVIATADQAVERRISYLVKSSIINCPVVFLWLEPFGVAGHLLYLNPQSRGCYQCCFDENGLFLYSVARANQNLSKRESGCQTVYSPVASIDTENFVGLATRKILELISNPAESALYTWLGDSNAFRARGYKINDMYLADSNGKLVIKSPILRQTCRVCKEFGAS